MFDLKMGFHIVTSSERLAATWTSVTLRTMDVGVMPSVGHVLVTQHTTEEGWHVTRKFRENARVVSASARIRERLLPSRLTPVV